MRQIGSEGTSSLSSAVSFYVRASSGRSPRNPREQRNWLASCRSTDSTLLIKARFLHGARAGRTRSRGGIAVILPRRVLRERDGGNETSRHRHLGNCANRVSSRERQKEAEAREFRERPRLLCRSEKRLDSRRKPIRSGVPTVDLWCGDPGECPWGLQKINPRDRKSVV